MVRAAVERVRNALRAPPDTKRAMELARAAREAADAEAKLDRCLAEALRRNPCAAAIIDITRALQSDINPAARPRPDDVE